LKLAEEKEAAKAFTNQALASNQGTYFGSSKITTQTMGGA